MKQVTGAPILTLDFIKQHCEGISGYWNGSDERFIDADGHDRHEEDAEIANDILEKVKEVEELLASIL